MVGDIGRAKATRLGPACHGVEIAFLQTGLGFERGKPVSFTAVQLQPAGILSSSASDLAHLVCLTAGQLYPRKNVPTLIRS